MTKLEMSGMESPRTAAQAEDWLGRWAMNLMLINVSNAQTQAGCPAS
jgi:hypothetical protein